MKAFAPACERNKEPIRAVLETVLPPTGVVLEIGSGTGQHAAYFATAFPHLTWQPSDLRDKFASIVAWSQDAKRANLLDPLEIDLLSSQCPALAADAILCINIVHIVAWRGVENLFSYAAQILRTGGSLYVYGPYRYPDRPLEPSNEEFDRWLKSRDPVSGVRDFAAVDAVAKLNGFTLTGDVPMPANNRSIWWSKR